MITVKFSEAVSFTSGFTGVSAINNTTGATFTPTTATLVTDTTIEYRGYWVGDAPAKDDSITWNYDGSGDLRISLSEVHSQSVTIQVCGAIVIDAILSLNGTNYAVLSEPVELTGDFEIEFILNTSENSYNGIFCNSALGLSGTYCRMREDKMQFANIRGVQIISNIPVNDGVDNIAKLVCAGLNYEFFINDVPDTAGVFLNTDSFIIDIFGFNGDAKFIGNLPYLKITDNIVPATPVVHSWKLNSGPGVYDLLPDIVVNGDASEGMTGWTTGNSLIVDTSGGTFDCTNSAGYGSLRQTNALEPIIYLVSFDLISWKTETSRISVNVGGKLIGLRASIDAVGHKEYLVKSLSIADLVFQSNTSNVGDGFEVDNIKFEPLVDVISDGTLLEPSEQHGIAADIMRLDEWVLLDPAHMSQNGRIVTYDGLQTDYATGKINSAETYSGLHMVVFRVYDETVGFVRLFDAGTTSQGLDYTTGVYKKYINIPVDVPATILTRPENSGFNGSVEIISIKPVKEGLIYENVTEDDWYLPAPLVIDDASNNLLIDDTHKLII